MSEFNSSASVKKNVFAYRNFRLVFFGALVSDLGAVLYSFAVGFYILEISGNNAFLQGLYLFSCGALQLVSTVFGGVLGDRYNKARIMFICDYLKGGLIILAMLLMLLFRENAAHIGILFVTGVLGSVVSGIFSPAARALLPHIVEESQFQQANAYFSIRDALLSILGVILAGVLYSALSIQQLFLMVGVCYLLSGVSEMLIRYEHQPAAGRLTLRLAIADFGGGIRYLKAQKALMVMLYALLFLNFFVTPVTSNFIPFFVKTDVAAADTYLFEQALTPELWYSVFSVLVGASTLIAAAILSTRPQADKMGYKISLRFCVMAGAMIVLAIGYCALVSSGVSLNAFLIVVGLCCAAFGFVSACINIPASTMLMRLVDKDMLGKASSIISILCQGLIPFASVLAGLVLQCFGSAALLLVCAAGFTAVSVWLLFNPRVKTI